MKLNITTIEYHRNGICGAPFHVILFREDEGRKVAILFEKADHCAVLDIDKLNADDVRFGSNSWRGDCYEPHLRKAVADRERRRR